MLCGPMSPKDDFASLMEASLASDASRTRRRPAPGDLVEGTVIQIGADSVFLDIGAAADARIERAELEDGEGRVRVRVGDRFRATVVDAHGEGAVLSLAMGRGQNVDASVVELASQTGAAIEGRVSRAVKGGLEVEIGKARAFCPASQIELGFAANLEGYVGQTLEFAVLEVRDGGRSIVVSRRALLQARQGERARELESELVPGRDLEGVVVAVARRGATVDVGGVQGFVHISELSHRRVERVEDVVATGDKVQVRVLSLERGEGGLNLRLSLKALAPPAATVEPGADEVLDAVVTRLAKFGVFVDTPKGEGLVPARELGLAPGADHRRAFPVGTTFKVVLLKRDPVSGKLSFSAQSVAGVEERKNYREFSGAPSNAHSLGSLGDVLRKKLGLPEPPASDNPPAPAPAPASALAPSLAPEPSGSAADSHPPKQTQPEPAPPSEPARSRAEPPPGVVRRKKRA
jgi:small subunit ribosomal protein S1